MADRLFGAALADFIMAFGDLGFIYEDVAGTPTVTTKQGRQVLVPTPADTVGDPLITVKVYDSVSGTQLTELLDDQGSQVTELTVPTSWLNLGQILTFTVRDTETQTPPEGDVWLTTNATTGPWARAMPFTAELFTRLAAAETALDELATTSLADISDTPAADGQILVRNNSLGLYEPQDPASGSGEVSSVASVSPDGTGNVTTAALLSALGLTGTAADMTVLKARGYIGLAYTGSGYEPKPSGFTLAIRRGPQEPQSNLAVGDIWLQPQSSGS